MCNLDIRGTAAANGLRLWQVAAALGIADSALSRKLRKELPDDEKRKILAVIDGLAQGGAECE